MAKVLSGWLVLGAILLAFVASSIGLRQPFRIDEPHDLTITFVLLAGWLAVYFVLAGLAIADAVRLTRRRDLDGLQRSAKLVKPIAAGFLVLNFVVLVEVVALIGSDDGLAGIALALLLIVLTYMVFLPAAAYPVATLVLQHILGTSRRPGPLPRNLLAVVVGTGSLLSMVWFVLVAIYWLADHSGAFVSDGIFLLNLVPPVEFLLLVVIPVVPLVTFTTAVRYYLAGDLDALRRSARTVGLAAIPLYAQLIAICVFIVVAVTSVVSIYGSHGQPKPTNVAIIGAVTSIGLVPAVLAALVMLLPIFIYGLTGLVLRMRRGPVE